MATLATPLSPERFKMIDLRDLLASEIREITFSDSPSARSFSLELLRSPVGMVENLVLLKDCFLLELRLDCEC